MRRTAELTVDIPFFTKYGQFCERLVWPSCLQLPQVTERRFVASSFVVVLLRFFLYMGCGLFFLEPRGKWMKRWGLYFCLQLAHVTTLMTPPANRCLRDGVLGVGRKRMRMCGDGRRGRKCN